MDSAIENQIELESNTELEDIENRFSYVLNLDQGILRKLYIPVKK